MKKIKTKQPMNAKMKTNFIAPETRQSGKDDFHVVPDAYCEGVRDTVERVLTTGWNPSLPLKMTYYRGFNIFTLWMFEFVR
jgi:hypothetical protein